MKTQFFFHQTLDYSQIYNFTLDHDYEFKIIIVLMDVWVSKSKSVYVFLFFECFEHGSLLVEYIKVQEKFEMIWWTFDKEKRTFETKRHMSTCFSWML
jgi:hypothetical protein